MDRLPIRRVSSSNAGGATLHEASSWVGSSLNCALKWSSTDRQILEQMHGSDEVADSSRSHPLRRSLVYLLGTSSSVFACFPLAAAGFLSWDTERKAELHFCIFLVPTWRNFRPILQDPSAKDGEILRVTVALNRICTAKLAPLDRTRREFPHRVQSVHTWWENGDA